MTIQILIAGTGVEVHKRSYVLHAYFMDPSKLALLSLLCAFVKDQNKPAMQLLFYDRYSPSD